MVRTGPQGRFSLSMHKDRKDRHFRVQVRFRGDDLEVDQSKVDDVASFDLLGRDWRTIHCTSSKRPGPNVDVGTTVFGPGGDEDLGDLHDRRRALVWYTSRTIIDRFREHDAALGLARKVG